MVPSTSMQTIFHHRYTLRSRGALNAKSSRTEFEGALIRIGDGFGCLHPWPELGDPALNDLLADLAKNAFHPLCRGAISSCAMDLDALREATFPRSHYLLPPGDNEVPAGFDTVKLKCSGSEADVARLRELPGSLKLRIDLNESLRVDGFLAFWHNLSDLADRIEFVEDPTPFDEETWDYLGRGTGCALALDRSDACSAIPPIRVIKPALHSAKVASPNQKLVYTSYMDHPVGQWYAAHSAIVGPRPEDRLTCGLVTHHLFDDSDPFIAAMGPPEPILRIPPNFRDLLDELPWKLLKASS
tara:strand:- start:9516 stop:10415 length:900 start_codon:yes stop_codon:yes gene_type:complete